jgi:hypothetical protein
MKEEIIIGLPELRDISKRIINLVSEATGTQGKISIKTAINNDLGIQGDDWDTILLALYEKEGLRLHGFNFYDYFFDEGQISMGIFGDIISLPIKLTYFLFSFKWLYTKNWNTYFGFTTYKPKPNLTIGDLITSRIEGRFVPRVDRHFKLVCS